MRVRKKGRAGRRGVALVYAMFGAFVAATMVSVVFTIAGVTSRRAGFRQSQVQARYLAEGGVEAAKLLIADAVSNFTAVPTQGSVDIDEVNVEFTIEDISGEQILVDATGIQTIYTSYEIESRVVIGGYPSYARRLVNTEATPVFQFAVFYDSDLEIQPGPSMSLGGRVHSNGDMHLSSGGTLTLDTNYVHAVGNIYRARKDGNTNTGDVTIREWVVDPFDPSEPADYVAMLNKAQLDALGVDSTSGYDSNFQAGYDIDGDGFFTDDGEWLPFDAGALEYWNQPDGYTDGTGNTLQTGVHGVSEASAPDVGSVAKFVEQAGGGYDENGAFVGLGLGDFGKGYYHENAGLTLLVNENGTDFEAYQQDGTDIKQDLIDAGVVGMIGVPDYRQSGGSNDLTDAITIDMAALNASGFFPSNGLIYASHFGLGEGTDSKGVYLSNGAELQDKLTVVSDGSAYIQGEFNTLNKKGASVIADGVNLLSNAWDGTKSGNSLPGAEETTFNVAIITGNQNTEPGSYGGGFENLPRFHENWSGVPCNITGSFVNTWESVYATGPWGGAPNIYTPPGRNWNYDPDFNSIENLPPFTPSAVTVRDVISW